MANVQQLNSFLNQQYQDRSRLDQEDKGILVKRWSQGDLSSLSSRRLLILALTHIALIRAVK